MNLALLRSLTIIEFNAIGRAAQPNRLALDFERGIWTRYYRNRETGEWYPIRTVQLFGLFGHQNVVQMRG